MLKDNNRNILSSVYPSRSLLHIDISGTSRANQLKNHLLPLMLYEEYIHSLRSSLGFMRNVRLLEKNNQLQLFKMIEGEKSILTSTNEIVRCEKACRQITNKSRPLVETADLFLIEKLLDHPTATERLQTIATLLRELKLFPPEMKIDEEDTDIIRNLSKIRGKSRVPFYADPIDNWTEDKREVNMIEAELEWLNQASKTLLLPRLASNLALDIPYFITPLTPSKGEQKSIEEVDFVTRFLDITEVFRKLDKKRELQERPVIKQYADYEKNLLKRSPSGKWEPNKKRVDELIHFVYKEVAREADTAIPVQHPDNRRKISVQNIHLPLIDIPLKNPKLKYMRDREASKTSHSSPQIQRNHLSYLNTDAAPTSIGQHNIVRHQPINHIFDETEIEIEVLQKNPRIDSFGGIIYVPNGNTVLTMNNEISNSRITPTTTYDDFWKLNYMMTSLVDQLLFSQSPKKEPGIQCPLCDYLDQIQPKKNNETCKWHRYVKAVEKIQQEFRSTEASLENIKI